MTNKNYDILKEALDSHNPLHKIKLFSHELKNFELSEYLVENLNLKNMEIKNISFKKITFKNCTFDNCIFHKIIFENCIIIDTLFIFTDLFENNFSNTSFKKIIFKNGLIKHTVCQSISIEDSTFNHFDFDLLSFNESQFNHNSMLKGICYSCKILLSSFEDNALEKTAINNTTFEKTSLNSNQIISSSLKKNIFLNCRFTKNSLIKTTALKNTGIDASILKSILSNKGRIEPFYTLLVKHPFYTFLGAIPVFFIPFFIYYQLGINPQYEYFRYIFNHTFSQFYRTDFSNNVLLLFKLTFKQQELIPCLNEAVAYRKKNNPQKSIQKILNTLEFTDSKDNNYNLYLLIMTWILEIETEDEKCKKYYKQFIQFIPLFQRNKLRLFIIAKNEEYYFPQTAYLIIQEYLLNSTSLNELSLLISTLNNIYNPDLKNDASIIIHSFIKRLKKSNPNQQNEYEQLSEIIHQWEK